MDEDDLKLKIGALEHTIDYYKQKLEPLEKELRELESQLPKETKTNKK
jgi:hypothetical protein